MGAGPPRVCIGSKASDASKHNVCLVLLTVLIVLLLVGSVCGVP